MMKDGGCTEYYFVLLSSCTGLGLSTTVAVLHEDIYVRFWAAVDGRDVREILKVFRFWGCR